MLIIYTNMTIPVLIRRVARWAPPRVVQLGFDAVP